MAAGVAFAINVLAYPEQLIGLDISRVDGAALASTKDDRRQGRPGKPADMPSAAPRRAADATPTFGSDSGLSSDREVMPRPSDDGGRGGRRGAKAAPLPAEPPRLADCGCLPRTAAA